ncbi:MAG: hypothetical protein BYD32DRAFT_408255 [Podila humilis]|nr:MAG: hypothetical protein BYD32DRAFT_408255 [Podila humilis]
MADPWDDWEQAGDAEIKAPVATPKKTPMILQRKKTPEPTKPTPINNVSLHEQNRAIWDKANAYEQPIIARTDNNTRTEYVPEIRILRRPKSPVTTVRVAATPSKPLEQRQADYNAAREKIFGPQDSSNNNSSSSSSTSSSPSSSRPGSRRGSPTPRSSITQVATQGQGQGQGTPVKPIEFRGAPRIRPAQRSTSGSNAQDHVVRQPRGPTMAAPASHNNTNSPRSLMARPPQESRNDTRGQGGAKVRGDAWTSSSSSSGGGGGGESIGFRKPFKGGPPPSQSS